MRLVISSIALLVAIQACLSLGKVTHHKHHKRSLGKTHKKVNLPMVLYYNKNKGEKARVARSANPTYPPTVTKTLFDYTGGYQNWNFNFNDKHPIQMDWSKPQPFAKPADNASQQSVTAPAQQSNDATQAAAPAQQQTQQQPEQQQQQQAAYPTQQQQSAFQPQTAAPVAPAAPAAPAAQPAQPAAEQQQPQQQDVPAFRIPAKAFKLADAGKDVYINVPQNTQTNTQQTPNLNAPLNDQPEKDAQKDDGPIQSFNYKPVKVPCPNGQECNYKGPNAPQINETFMLYCDDKFPNCGVLHSSCNESWLQVYCPKRCGICSRTLTLQHREPMTSL